MVSFAVPAQGSTSLLEFSPPSEQTTAQFKADVQYLQSLGKKVLLSLGGGSQIVTLNTAADVQNFVSSVAAIVQQYGFDGIDLDIENPSLILDPGDTDFRNPTTPSIVNLIAACRQLRNQFGSNFMLTMVPEVVQVQAGFESYSGTSGSFLPVIYGLKDILSFVDAQDYDTPPLPGLDRNFYIPGTADYHVAMTEMLLAGFPVAHNPNNFFPPLPPEKVAIGAIAGPQVRHFVSMSGLSNTLNYLIKGVPYGGQYVLQNPAGYPNMLGMMAWSDTIDRYMNYQFSNTIGPLLHQMPAVVPHNCTYSLNPTSASLAGNGGAGSISVTAGDGCNWIVQNWTSGADWLTVTSGSAGTGNGAVNYQASANTGNPRSATLTIAGVSFTVNQSCGLLLNAEGASFPAGSGTGTITITTGPACTWTASSALGWVTVTGGASGSGDGTVSYTVAANTDPAARSGTMTIAGLTYTVEQESASAAGLNFAGSMAQIASAGSWDTLITLINAGEAAAEARLNFFSDPAGSPLLLPFAFPQQPALGTILGTTFDSTVFGGTFHANAMLLLDTTGPVDQVGSAQLLTNGAVSGFAVFKATDTGQEAVAPLETGNASSYILAFDNTGGIVTGVAIANVASAAGNVPVVIRDDTGAQIGTGSIPLAAEGHTSFVLTDATKGFPVTAGKRGTVEFDTPAGGQISVLGLRFPPSSVNAFTSVPVLANVTSSGGTMAHLASAGSWKTTITLVNTGTASANAHLHFFGDSGSPLSLPLSFPQSGSPTTASTLDRTLAAGAMLIIESTGPVAQVGSAQLTTDGAVSGFAVFKATDTGQEAVVPLETRNPASFMLAFDNTGGIVTGVAIANVASQAGNVPVVIRDDTGTEIGTGSIALAAEGHKSFVLTDATTGFPVTAGKRGTIEFETPAGGQISVLGLRFPPSNANAFTTIPVMAPCCCSGCVSGGGNGLSPLPPTQGSLVVTITSLPTATSASVTVSGPSGYSTQLTSSQTLQLAPGTYSVIANPVSVGGSNYYPTVASQTATVSISTPASVTVDYSTIIPTSTKVLDSAGMISLTVSPDGSTITVSTSSAVAASLAAGDVLASAPAPAAENGLLVKILSVSTSGQTVTASVQQATLQDAIQQATFQFTETLGPGNTLAYIPASKKKILSSRTLGRLQREDYTSGAGACAGNTNTFQLPFDVPLAGGGGASLTLTGEEDFCPSFTFALKISGFQLVSMNATVTVGIHTSIGLLDSVEESFNLTHDFPPLNANSTLVLIGNVPILVQPTLTPFVGVSGNAAANAYTGIATDSITTVGVWYANGTWSPIATSASPTAVSTATSVDGQVSAKAFAGIQAGVLLNGIVVPYLSSDGYLQFNSSLTGNPCWTLNAGLEANVGVKVTILGETLTNYSSPSLNLFSVPVLQATNTCFAPVLTSIAPNTAPVMSPDLTLALTGSNFVPDSTANFNGQPLATTFLDPSDLTAVVPAIDLAVAGTFPVTVSSPDNPGGTSAPVTFTVSDVNVTVSLSTASASIPVGISQLFTATVQGTSNTAVTWSVNGVIGGNSTLGTITEQGLYTAPVTVPNPSAVAVTAASQAYPRASASASVTVLTSGYTFFNAEVFASPGTTDCDYPPPWTPASPPCLSALQSDCCGTALDLNVATNGATSEVQFDGVVFSVSASTTTATTDNRADAVGSRSNSYVLTSTSVAAGTPVSLTALLPRSGTLSVQALQVNDTVTAQESFMVNFGLNGVLVNSGINQGERVFTSLGPTYTESSLADSNVFTFGLSGNNPVLLSEPNIVDTDATQSSVSTTLGTLTVNFTVPVGLPFGLGVYDHVNTHGGDSGNATSTGVIPEPQFVLPPNVVLHKF